MGKNAPEDTCLKVDQLSLGLADISLDSAQNDGGDWELGMDFHASALKNKLKIFRDSINKIEELEKLQQQEQELEKVKQSNGNSSNNEEHNIEKVRQSNGNSSNNEEYSGEKVTQSNGNSINNEEYIVEKVRQSNGNSSNNEEHSGMKVKEISWDLLLDRFQVKQIEEAELSEMLIKGDALHGFTDERKKREGWISDSEVIELLCGH